MRKLYLAGPAVFRKDAFTYANALKKACSEHGFIGVFPLDNDVDSCCASEIKYANINLIRKCDGVIADYTPFRGPGLDGGTAYEIGFAEALGKPVVAFSGDTRDYLCRVNEWMSGAPVDTDDLIKRDHNNMSIEDFDLPDNLMLTSDIAVFDTVDAALNEMTIIMIAKDRGND